MDDKLLDITSLSAERLELLELLLMEEMDIQQIQPSELEAFREYPLSFAQQRLWFLDHLKPGNFTYNETVAVRLIGRLNLAVLEQSLNEIIRRHESLRTTFTLRAGRPVQIITAPQAIHLTLHDLSSVLVEQRDRQVQILALKETQTSFNLEEGPLLRLCLLQLEQKVAVVLLTIHHIISDGWSMRVFVRELAALYTAYLQGAPSPLADLSIQYRDFAIWQRQWFQGSVLEQQLAYWKNQLSAPLPTLQLPLDRPRSSIQSFRGATYFFHCSSDLSTSLKALGQRENTTFFMTLMAAFNVLLHYYCGQDDLVVGTDVANRNRAETEELIGFFVNQLVLRTSLAGNPSFNEILQRVREVTLAAFAHQDLPFDKLVEALNPERDLSQTPLFQVKFVLQNVPIPSLELPGLTLNLMEFDRGIAKFDLLLNMWDTDNGLSGALDYNTDLFDTTTISLMIKHFEAILYHCLASDVRLDVLEEMLRQFDEKQRTQRYQERRFTNSKTLRKIKSGKAMINADQSADVDGR